MMYLYTQRQHLLYKDIEPYIIRHSTPSHSLFANIYILYEEKQILKSAKSETRAVKGKLGEFDNYIIYRVYIED